MTIRIVVSNRFWLISNPSQTVPLQFSLSDSEALTFDSVAQALRVCTILENYEVQDWELVVGEYFVLRSREKPNVKKEMFASLEALEEEEEEGEAE